MPLITLLPAAARLLVVGFPDPDSMMPLDPFRSITEFRFYKSFFAVGV